MSREEQPQRAAYYRPGPARKDPAPVDDVIAGVIERFGAPGIAGGQVVAAWPELAGEWADRSVPIGVRDGVLTVEVANGADASVLRYDLAVIRAKIDAAIGRGIVSRIQVRVARDRGQRTGAPGR